jgi:hypothetical protein
MLFHGQQQHVVVSLDGKIDQVYVRAAVDVVLKACLSPEDWEAATDGTNYSPMLPSQAMDRISSC